MEDDIIHSGVGFTGLLFLVFLVLKLTHVIDWSWWWITAPLWIPTILIIVIAIVVIIGTTVVIMKRGKVK